MRRSQARRLEEARVKKAAEAKTEAEAKMASEKAAAEKAASDKAAADKALEEAAIEERYNIFKTYLHLEHEDPVLKAALSLQFDRGSVKDYVQRERSELNKLDLMRLKKEEELQKTMARFLKCNIGKTKMDYSTIEGDIATFKGFIQQKELEIKKAQREYDLAMSKLDQYQEPKLYIEKLKAKQLYMLLSYAYSEKQLSYYQLEHAYFRRSKLCEPASSIPSVGLLEQEIIKELHECIRIEQEYNSAMNEIILTTTRLNDIIEESSQLNTVENEKTYDEAKTEADERIKPIFEALQEVEVFITKLEGFKTTRLDIRKYRIDKADFKDSFFDEPMKRLIGFDEDHSTKEIGLHIYNNLLGLLYARKQSYDARIKEENETLLKLWNKKQRPKRLAEYQTILKQYYEIVSNLESQLASLRLGLQTKKEQLELEKKKTSGGSMTRRIKPSFRKTNHRFKIFRNRTYRIKSSAKQKI